MAALKSLGIAAGDRVAIAGTNSTRYLTLDVAIGMIGAVSVPLYYTSPPTESIISWRPAARACFSWASAGCWQRLGEIRSDVPVISFSSDPRLRQLRRDP
jgi:long-chain acyl-CoA synthetase